MIQIKKLWICYLVLIVPLWNWNVVIMSKTSRGVVCFNRTFMELKFRSARRGAGRHPVLIVPLWNWNVSTITTDIISSSVLIVPLWNWNCRAMGFYLLAVLVLIVPLWNWNLLRVVVPCRAMGVLIVPLWNWNLFRSVCCPHRPSRFNRTFMELKFWLISSNWR